MPCSDWRAIPSSNLQLEWTQYQTDARVSLATSGWLPSQPGAWPPAGPEAWVNQSVSVLLEAESGCWFLGVPLGSCGTGVPGVIGPGHGSRRGQGSRHECGAALLTKCSSLGGVPTHLPGVQQPLQMSGAPIPFPGCGPTCTAQSTISQPQHYRCLGRTVLSCGDCAEPCRVFSSVPGLYLLLHMWVALTVMTVRMSAT